MGFFPTLPAKNLASNYVNNCRPRFPTKSGEATSVCTHLHGGLIMMGAHGLGEKGGCKWLWDKICHHGARTAREAHMDEEGHTKVERKGL